MSDLINAMAQSVIDYNSSEDSHSNIANDIICALEEAEKLGWRLVPVEPDVSMVEPVACELSRILNPNIDPQGPCPPHGEYPIWYECGGPAKESLSKAIKAAPRPWSEDD